MSQFCYVSQLIAQLKHVDRANALFRNTEYYPHHAGGGLTLTGNRLLNGFGCRCRCTL